jgi:hypothetical protein
VAGLISKISEMIVRRKWGKLHPAVGLPKDAPEYLETENGSFVRPCPEDEWIPFAAQMRSVAYMIPIVGLGGMCMAAGIAYLAKNFPIYEGMLFGAMLETLGLTVFCLFIVVMRFDRALKKAPGLLLDRASRVFDPGDASFAAGVDPSGGRKKQFLIPDEVAIARAIPGYLEFEMSRAQVRVAAEDMKLYLGRSTSSSETGLNVRCDFGDLEWSVVIGKFRFLPKAGQTKPRFFQWLKRREPAQSLARYLQRSMAIPEQDIAYPPETETFAKIPLPLVLSITPSDRAGENIATGCAFGAIPIFLSAFILLLLSPILLPPGRENIPYWAAAMLLIVLIFWWPVRAFLRHRRMRQVGTWTLEDDGITYEPLERPPFHLSWDEVRRVRWSDSGVELVGSRETIRIDKYSFKKEEIKKVRQVIQNQLATHFDFSTRPPIRSKLLLRAYMVSIVGSLFIAPLVVLSVLRGRWDNVGRVIALLIVAAFVLPCILFTWWIKRQDKRLNPEWRERRKGTHKPGPESDLGRGGEGG